MHWVQLISTKAPVVHLVTTLIASVIDYLGVVGQLPYRLHDHNPIYWRIRRTMKNRLLQITAVFAFVLFCAPALAFEIKIGEHTNFQLNYLLQVHAQFAEGAADNGGWSKDFFIRRSRLVLRGDLWKNISFFFGTNQANWGKGGKWNSPLIVQDTIISFKVVEEFQVDVGLMPLPFSRANMLSMSNLNALYCHFNVIKFVPGSHNSYRDIGVQIRGNVYKKKLQYRLGIFTGAKDQPLQKDAQGNAIKDNNGKDALKSNPEQIPRFAGHIRYSFLGQEGAPYYRAMLFGKTPSVSIGGGFDYQSAVVMSKAATLDSKKAVIEKGILTGAYGLSFDVFADVPIGEKQEVVIAAAVFWYDHGNELAYDTSGAATLKAAKASGFALSTEVGYRYDFAGAYLVADWFKGKRAKNDMLDIRGGLVFWIRQHSASVKMEFSGVQLGDLATAKWNKAFTTQVQLYY